MGARGGGGGQKVLPVVAGEAQVDGLALAGALGGLEDLGLDARQDGEPRCQV
jgi:hypothetical protein